MLPQSKFGYTLLFFILLVLHLIAGVYFDDYSMWWIALSVVAFLLICAAGSFFIGWNFYIKSQHKLPMLQLKFTGGKMHLEHTQNCVALTFDDGPAATTAAVLDILKKEKVPATFFLIGKHIEGNETIVKRMMDEGHKIGNHSFYHGVHFDWQSSRKMLEEMDRTNQAIEQVTGNAAKLFRPPYGVTNPNLAKAINQSGLLSIGWSVRSKDTVAKNADELLCKICNNVKNRDIILLHDRCAITVQILPTLIASLKEKGFGFSLV
ncbi:MAG: polysaccharide deacetylase family protein [Edaphocola sp.]